MAKKRPRLIEALKIIRDARPKTNAEFAHLFWPDSPMHRKRTTSAGPFGSQGAGLYAAGYLGKLEKQGYIIRYFTSSPDDLIARLAKKGEDTLANLDEITIKK